MRAILDANVLVSALLSRIGAPARLVELWLAGGFELVVCDSLLREVERALEYPKIRSRIAPADARQFVAMLRELAENVDEPNLPAPVHSPDPGDDYLLALAARERVALVAGDSHLLGLGGRLPIVSPREFLGRLEDS